MSTALDPYFDWLGIPPSEQPPHYYRLLGIAPFETDLTKIIRASQAQIAKVSAHLTGPAGVTAQQLLQVINQAQVCLADANSKKIYDDYLRTLLPPSQPSAKSAPRNIAPPADSPVEVAPPDGASELDFLASGRSAGGSSSNASIPVGGTRRPHSGGGSGLGKVIAVFGPTAVIAGILYYASQHDIAHWFDSGDANKPAKTATKQDPQKAARANPKSTDPVAANGQKNGKTGSQAKSKQPPLAARGSAEGGFGGVLTNEVFDFEAEMPGETKGESPNRSTSGASKPQPAIRRPVPDEAALAKTQKVILEIYGKDLQTAKSSSEKVAIGETIFSQALQSGNDAAAQYALFHSAKDLGLEATELPLVLRAVEALAAHFDVEPTELKLDALTKFSEKGNIAGHYRRLIEAALQGSGDAHAKDDFDRAIAFARLALNNAAKINDAKLTQKITDRGKELVALKGLWTSASAGQETLKSAADDPNANAAVGKWLCLVKRDFSKGIPHLAKGGDTELRVIAQLDAADPSEPDAQLSLADHWWDLAQSTDAAWEKNSAFRRADHWYQKSLGSQAGLSKTRVEKRLDDIKKLLAAEEAAKEGVVPPSLTGAFGRSVISTSPIKLAAEDVRRNVAGDAFEFLSRDPKIKIERLDVWEFDESGNVQLTNVALTGGSKRITDQTDTIARWDVGDNAIALNFSKAPLVGTMQFTARHEGIGVVKSNRGELAFTFQFKRIVPVAKCAVRFPDKKTEPAELVFFTSGSIGRKCDPQHSWSVRGNQLTILDQSAADGTYTLSDEKTSFTGRSKMGRDVDGRLVPMDPPK